MSLFWIVILWIVRGVAVVLIVGTLLPFIRTGSWMVRIWGFPRLQLATIALLVAAGLLAFAILLTAWADWVLFGLLAAAAVWQLTHVAPYTRLWTTRVADADGRGIRFMIANLDVRNPRRDEAAPIIERSNPDVLLLIEIDAEWERVLSPLRARYPFHIEDIRPEGHGIALWSRLPLEHEQIRCLVSDERPSIDAFLRLPDGSRIRFVGLHPVPPGLADDDAEGRYDSRIRDAELMLVARAVESEDDTNWIVAGDFNDVAWSYTTRLFQDLSGLVDPRVGRGLYNTYHARYFLLRYPLDHVFVSPSFKVGRFRRVTIPGSDHFAVLIELQPGVGPPTTPDIDADKKQEQSELIHEGKEDAAERDEATP